MNGKEIRNCDENALPRLSEAAKAIKDNGGVAICQLLHYGSQLLLDEMLGRNARKFPYRLYVVFEDPRFTYKKSNARVNRLALSILSVGIGKGDHVAVLMHN